MDRQHKEDFKKFILDRNACFVLIESGDHGIRVKNIEKIQCPELFDLIASFVLHDGSLFSHLITELFMKTYNVDLDHFNYLIERPVDTRAIEDFRDDLERTEKELIRVLSKINNIDRVTKEAWIVTMEIDYNRFPIKVRCDQDDVARVVID